MATSILIVDDESNMREVLSLLFKGEGYETETTEDAEHALALFDSGHRFDVVISDLNLGKIDGIHFLKELKSRSHDTPFVLITAYGTVEKAVEIMKLGAIDVVTKPFAGEIILNIVSRICRMERLKDQNENLKSYFKQDELIFASAKMREIAKMIAKIGPTTAPVLITGESGTGKEVVSRNLHRAFAGGDMGGKAFISVNCPAVPETLLESELFGYRKGAFTGANHDYKGKVELADGGTLFFDEIGDLPLAIQPKLLRLLENRTYEPLGMANSRKVDIRVVCATNKDLKRLVREGAFREDLFYRINTFTINLPPLRDRREDILSLADFFLDRYSMEMRKSLRGFSGEVMQLFERYDWPGNVRELRNVVERAVVLCGGMEIELVDVPSELLLESSASSQPQKGGSALVSMEKRLMIEALEANEWNVCAAARSLGVTRNTMRYRMEKYAIREQHKNEFDDKDESSESPGVKKGVGVFG